VYLSDGCLHLTNIRFRQRIKDLHLQHTFIMEEDFETFDTPGPVTEAMKAEISHFETVVKSFLYYEHHGAYVTNDFELSV
jgi:hypothetical protein